MSFFGFISRLKIGTRIGGGFALVLLLLVVVAATAYVELNSGRATFGRYSTVAANTVRIVQADRDFTELRRSGAVLVQTGSQESRAAIRERAQAVREILAETAERLIDADRREATNRVRTTVDQYVANLDRVAERLAERQRLVDETMTPLGARLRSTIAELVEAALGARDFEAAAYLGIAQDQLMLARFNASRYLASPEPALLTAIAEEFAAVGSAIERARGELRTAAHQAQLAQVGAQVPQYAAAIQAAARTMADIDNLVNQVNAPLADQIAQGLAAIRTSQTSSLAAMREQGDADIGETITITLTLTGVALALGVLFAWLIGRGISVPVKAMTGAMTTLAEGDLAIEIPSRDNRDEIGDMAKAVQVFKDNAIRVKRMEAEAEEQKQRAEAEKKAALDKMADDFEASVGGVVKAVSAAATELQSAATSMSSTAEETSRQSTAVAAASEQASTNVTTVATATEELSASIAEITRQVSQSAQIASMAVEESDRTTGAVRSLSEGATKIGDVVKLINDIAGQTNLLALNATIEAARAGEAGKGFAVVAAEVKNLATQTAKATEEIAAQVNMIQAATGQSVAAIEGIGGTIRKINEIATTIASAVEEQGAATQEIARNVQQASAGTRDVSSNIAGVTQAAAETGTAAAQVQASASELSQQSETLRSQMDQFLATIRAA